MKRLLMVALVGWLCSFGAALAQPDQVYTIPEFTFENGEKLQNMKVGYSTHGTLNADRSNAILITHGTSQNRNVYNLFIGPGKALDTDKYFVIAVDAIGGGLSSQPKDGLGTAFPEYTVRDMVRAQHDLVTKHHEVLSSNPSGHASFFNGLDAIGKFVSDRQQSHSNRTEGHLQLCEGNSRPRSRCVRLSRPQANLRSLHHKIVGLQNSR